MVYTVILVHKLHFPANLYKIRVKTSHLKIYRNSLNNRFVCVWQICMDIYSIIASIVSCKSATDLPRSIIGNFVRRVLIKSFCMTMNIDRSLTSFNKKVLEHKKKGN